MMLRASSLALLLAATCPAYRDTAEVRMAALAHVRAGTQAEGEDAFAGRLAADMAAVSRPAARDLARMAVLAESARFLRFAAQAGLDPAVAGWLLASDERLHTFMDLLDPLDDPAGCAAVLAKLHALDPQGREAFFNLALAIAVVYDRPSARLTHGQMGRERVAPERDPAKIYGYFRQLYASGEAKIDYAALAPSELVFAVHAPTSLDELAWARANVGGPAETWGDKYSEIAYDHARLRSSRFQWDHGPYTLQAIRLLGGICTDQAFHAVATARAHGIPAIYFHGSGKSANHAWFAFMRAPGKWVLDVGRYQDDAYTTGFAVNPQTGQAMTDHDVEYAYERSLHSPDFARSSAFVSIAEVLAGRDPAAAMRCARAARDLVKRNLRAWRIEQELLAQDGDISGMLAQFGAMKDAFRKYPDILVDAAKRIEPLLRKAGRGDEADRLLRGLASGVAGGRDDLSRSFETERIEQIAASGDLRRARKEMERLLQAEREGGSKVFGLIDRYIELGIASDGTRETARFLDGYAGRLMRETSLPPGYEQMLLEKLLKAHESAGDERNAQKTRKTIERLGYEQNR